MRTILMVLMIAGLMSTVGVYAASLGTPTIDRIGGTTSQTVNAPNTGSVTLTWNFTGSQVTGVDVAWTTVDARVHTIKVTAGGTTGSFTTPSTGAAEGRVDTVPLSATDAVDITSATVVIF